MEKRSSPKIPERAIPGPDQLRQGIERLQRQIGELEAFSPSSVRVRWATETQAIQTAIADLHPRARSPLPVPFSGLVSFAFRLAFSPPNDLRE